MKYKFPYWEKRGWRFQKMSYSKKNTELAVKNNKKRDFQTKVIKTKQRPSGSRYSGRALLIKKREERTNNRPK